MQAGVDLEQDRRIQADIVSSHSSRTISLAQMGLGSLLLLSLVILLALAMSVSGDELRAVADVVSTLGMSIAAVATGCGVGHSARHFGAKEPSGTRSTNA